MKAFVYLSFVLVVFIPCFGQSPAPATVQPAPKVDTRYVSNTRAEQPVRPDARQSPHRVAPADERLRQFLTGFENVMAAYGRALQTQMKDGSTRGLAEHFTSVMDTQASRLSAFVLDANSRAGAGKRAEVEELLTRQAAVELTNVPQAIYMNMDSPAAFKGVSGILTLGKKIVRTIVGLFGDEPPWLNGLLELIDELVAEAGGLFSPQLQRDINETEIDYLRAMYYLERLNRLEHSEEAVSHRDR